MKYSWDENKNSDNIRKHGLDFTDVRDVFQNPLLTKLDNRYDYTEDRFVGIGKSSGRYVVVVYTKRDNGIIRIISFRKANSRERKIYEKAIKD
jgi:uncharacterized DUF497 family protein